MWCFHGFHQFSPPCRMPSRRGINLAHLRWRSSPILKPWMNGASLQGTITHRICDRSQESGVLNSFAVSLIQSLRQSLRFAYVSQVLAYGICFFIVWLTARSRQKSYCKFYGTPWVVRICEVGVGGPSKRKMWRIHVEFRTLLRRVCFFHNSRPWSVISAFGLYRWWSSQKNPTAETCDKSWQMVKLVGKPVWNMWVALKVFPLHPK